MEEGEFSLQYYYFSIFFFNKICEPNFEKKQLWTTLPYGADIATESGRQEVRNVNVMSASQGIVGDILKAWLSLFIRCTD